MDANITIGSNLTYGNMTSSLRCFSIKCLFTDLELWAIVASLSVTFVASLIGNVLVCILIMKNRKLRNATNYSIMNLSIADLLVTLFCIPAVTVDLYIADQWIFGHTACKLVSFIQNISLDASVLSLMIISVEKFLVVWFPFFLRDKSKYVKWCLLAVWIVGVLQSLVTLHFRELVEFRGKHYCIEKWPDWEIRRRYITAKSTLLFFLPLLMMLILHILTIARIRGVRMPCTSNESDHHGFKQRFIRVIKSDKLARRKKAMHMLILIFFIFAIGWSPIQVLKLWIQYIDVTSANTRAVNIGHVVGYWLIFFSCACHPVIYGLAGSKYRTAIRRSFSWRQSPDTSFKRRPSSTKRKRSCDTQI